MICKYILFIGTLYQRQQRISKLYIGIYNILLLLLALLLNYDIAIPIAFL